MQLFFNTPSALSYGVPRYSQWNVVREGLLRNLNNTQNYYRSRIFAVRGNHFLVRLINTINVSHNLELERYYDIADAKTYNIAAAMKMTSACQRGSMFDGVFYGQGCPEIIMVDDSSFDPFDTFRNWRTVQAVKVVKHPRSDLALMLPNGRVTGSETGLAVISINIPMLAIQFKAWAAEQISQNDRADEGYQTVPHFVHRFVLPNMLTTHLDLAVFNRLSNLINGAPLGESLRVHPFAMADYTDQATKAQQAMIRDMVNRSQDYRSVLSSIPAVTEENMINVMKIPNNAPTRQVMWAEVLSRIDELSTIVKLGGEQSIGRNMTDLTSFAREFRFYRQDKAISTFVPQDLYKDTWYQMDKIGRLAGKQFTSA